MDEKVEEKSKLVIDALSYAHSNNLDINNEGDVKKILKALNAGEEDIEEFMKLLQAGDTFLDMEATKKDSEKTNLPN